MIVCWVNNARAENQPHARRFNFINANLITLRLVMNSGRLINIRSRKHTSSTTEMDLARADANGEHLQVAKLDGELHSLNALISTLDERIKLLARKRGQFELITPRAGIVFGEELPRMVGQYYKKGS